MRGYKNRDVLSFKALDSAEGTFEAIVAVFGNVDRAGDKIIPGAFKASLAAWKAKGRPIPVIYSHEWDNLDAHIGKVLEARETDRGLYVKGQLDLEEDFAARVWKKMREGTLAEFSFAYDVVDAKQVGKVNELRKLDLLEVGPCLVGMNPRTELLSVKGAAADVDGARRLARELVAAGVDDRPTSPSEVKRWLAELDHSAPNTPKAWEIRADVELELLGQRVDEAATRRKATRAEQFVAEAVAAGCTESLARAHLEGQVEATARQIMTRLPGAGSPLIDPESSLLPTARRLAADWWTAPAS